VSDNYTGKLYAVIAGDCPNSHVSSEINRIKVTKGIAKYVAIGLMIALMPLARLG
jgi:hypothetical protein